MGAAEGSGDGDDVRVEDTRRKSVGDSRKNSFSDDDDVDEDEYEYEGSGDYDDEDYGDDDDYDDDGDDTMGAPVDSTVDYVR